MFGGKVLSMLRRELDFHNPLCMIFFFEIRELSYFYLLGDEDVV